MNDLPAPSPGLQSDTATLQRRRGLWQRLRQGLGRTQRELRLRMGAALEDRVVVDEALLDGFEEALIGADLGVETSLELVERLRSTVPVGQKVDLAALRERLVDELAILLLDAPPPPPRADGPLVTLVVGVNGAGKTTTIAKLARRVQEAGRRPLLAAADTFRAAAVEQLEVWGQRLGVDVIRQASGGDPGAVVHDALAAARARGVDDVLVDTAGRLHNKTHLMEELGKLRRIVDRHNTGHERPFVLRTLLVLDATTGQNAVLQAREFHRVTPVDALVLTKLDGTAKGGLAVAIARDLRLPILCLGVGEGIDDLVDFEPREFAAALLS